MKKAIGIFIVAAALALTSGCSRQEIWSTLVLRAQMPDGEEIAMITIDPSIEGNVIRNINTLEKYDFPAFIGGTARLTVLKGLYVISFDAVAELTDGREKKVRFSGYSTEANAAEVVDDEVTLNLNLTVLK